MDRNQLALLAVVVGALLWGVMCAKGSQPEVGPFFTALGPVVMALSLLYIAFDRWLWRLWGIRHLVGRGQPYIAGTWDAQIRSTWVDPATGHLAAPIHAYMAIRQTFNSLSLRVMTSESGSETLAARFVREHDGMWSIAMVYRNTPKAGVRDRSAIHLGAMLLWLQDDADYSLEGHYWTDRNTRGDVRLTNRRSQIFNSYDSALSSS